MIESTPTSRRAIAGFIAAAIASAAVLATSPASAQAASYPSRPVKLINGFAAGSPSDILGRSIADELQKSLGQPFVVENKPGAGGNIAADYVAKSAPDGYNVMLGIDSTFTINPAIYPSMPFAPTDLKPVIIYATSGLLAVTNAKLGIKTLPELIAKGKKEPLNFGSGGAGSPGHLALSILHEEAGVQTNHIPYKGNAPVVLAVMSGEVDAAIIAAPVLLPHVQSGKVTALATTGEVRSPLLPNVPTVAELGYKNLELDVLLVVMVPAATPDAIVQTLQKGITAALDKPDFKQRLQTFDLTRLDLTGDAAAKRLADDRARYAKIVKATGMKVD